MNFDSLAVLQALPDALLVCDADGVVQFVNPAAERLLHVRAEELVGGRELPYWEEGELHEGHFVKWGNQGAQMFLIQVSSFASNQYTGLIVRYEDKTSLSHQKMAIHYDMRGLIIPLTGAIGLIYGGFAGEVNESQRELIDIAQKSVRSLADYMEIVLHQLRLEGLPLDFEWEFKSFEAITRFWFDDFMKISDNHHYTIRCDESKLCFVFKTLKFLGSRSKQKNLNVIFIKELNIIEMGTDIQDVYFFDEWNYALSGLCQRIIEAHGGTFNYTKHADTASTFTITLPIAEPEQ